MIVGTAGHIDHGKTTLARALTGVDTDRLPEEKRRGITIELGFAPLVLDGVGTVGIVDVPGHEAFVRTMLAGAAGIDAGLLVVAADDGVRPQTREHLAILQLLGVRGGVIAITKCDLVDSDWIDLVEEDVRALIADTNFAGASIVRVSLGDETAIDALRGALADALAHCAARAPNDPFRLPIDRVFTVRGTGTVVTGTAWSGSLDGDAEVRILPSGAVARVRGIQTHGVAADRALPGQRTAIALGGVALADVHRGDVIVADPGWEAASVLRADVTLLAGAPRTLGARTVVRLHLATSEVGARVVATGGPIAPGDTRPVRLMLDAPIVARGGDRFVLRLASPPATIGGGIVTDAHAPRRSKPFASADLSPAERLRQMLHESGVRGLPATSPSIRLGVPADRVQALVVEAGGVTLHRSGCAVAAAVLEQERGRQLAFLRVYHQAHPLEAGVSLQELRTRSKAPADFVETLIEGATSSGAIEVLGAQVRVTGWRPALTDAQHKTALRLVERLTDQGWAPSSTTELTAEFGPETPDLLRLAADNGSLVQVEANRYYAGTHLEQIIGKIRESFPPDVALTAADLREKLGLSRKYLIPLLEHCDRTGRTVRQGDKRVWAG